MSRVYLTEEGLQKIKAELHQLKSVRRREISQRISVARDHGDLKENAEYKAAKEELQLVQAKINTLEEKVARAEVISAEDLATDEVALLTKVRLLDKQAKEECVYKIVPEEEADWERDLISVRSPIGRGLLGKKVGQSVKITTPGGAIEYKILEIGK